MYKLSFEPHFKKSLKKWLKQHPDLQEKFYEILNKLQANPHHPSLRTHKLKGNLNDYWALSVNINHRLIFQFLSDNEVFLIDISHHNKVYERISQLR